MSWHEHLRTNDGSASYTARVWLNQEMMRKLGERVDDKFGAKFRKTLSRDPEKRERVREQAILLEARAMSEEEREKLFDEVVDGMPRRLRRALGDRGHSFGYGSMAVPKSRKRSK